MKFTLKTSLFITATFLTAVVAFGKAHHSLRSSASFEAPIQTVIVTGKRMSEDEKLAYDVEHGLIQTVVVVGKRLSPAEKAAMLREELTEQAIAKQESKRVRRADFRG